MVNTKTNSSVNIESYQGYHLIMSDTINPLREMAAFRLTVHCDARQVPSVRLLSEDHSTETSIEKIRERTISSKSRIADGAKLHIFKPVELQPLTQSAFRQIQEQEANRQTQGASSS